MTGDKQFNEDLECFQYPDIILAADRAGSAHGGLFSDRRDSGLRRRLGARWNI
jgi:hypothetical protein